MTRRTTPPTQGASAWSLDRWQRVVEQTIADIYEGRRSRAKNRLKALLVSMRRAERR